MVIVSEEASDNTKKMFTNMCAHYKVPIYLFGTKDELGHAMGQEFRASLSVEDAGFAKSMAAPVSYTHLSWFKVTIWPFKNSFFTITDG